MPFFYRGAGIGTYWHQRDARLDGFVARRPGQTASKDQLIKHIARGTVDTPYVSLTRSYGIAWTYAIQFGQGTPAATAPAFVYEIELGEPLPDGLRLIDPVTYLAGKFPPPTADSSYYHDGDSTFLLGVINYTLMTTALKQEVRQPPSAQGTPRAPNLSPELETLVRALRDAEILAVGNVPASCVRSRYEVW
jgi:hypothetical protein